MFEIRILGSAGVEFTASLVVMSLSIMLLPLTAEGGVCPRFACRPWSPAVLVLFSEIEDEHLSSKIEA